MLTKDLKPGKRKKGAAFALRCVLAMVAGLYLFRFGLPGMVLGGEFIAGGSEVNSQLDSETRFLSAIALGVGVCTIWLIFNFERFPIGVAALSTFSLLGGIMRVVSIASYGIPVFTATFATVLEFVIPITGLTLVMARD